MQYTERGREAEGERGKIPEVGKKKKGGIGGGENNYALRRVDIIAPIKRNLRRKLRQRKGEQQRRKKTMAAKIEAHGQGPCRNP